MKYAMFNLRKAFIFAFACNALITSAVVALEFEKTEVTLEAKKGEKSVIAHFPFKNPGKGSAK